MLKRLGLAFAGLFAFLAGAQASGTIPGFSLTPQFDLTGKVMPGCKLAVIQAGTVATPQTAYQDSALTIPSPGGSNLTCDATGRLPQFFIADGLIKLRLTTSANVEVFVGDNLLAVGASSGGGGGGGSVDPTTILATGDFKVVYNTGALTGFVRCNGRTIGSATSGATERANADTSALYAFLYNADGTLPVAGGRGANAAADFAANKALTLPDCRGRMLAGLNDMGNSASTVLTQTWAGCLAGGDTIQLGITCGSQTETLTLGQLPTGINSAVAGDAIAVATSDITLANVSSGSGVKVPQTSGVWSGSVIVTSNNTGGLAHSIVPPMMLTTFYIKL